MKNFKIFKPILCLLLIFSLSLSLFGCVLNDVEDDPIESGTDTKADTETYIPDHIKYDKVKDYSIIEVDGGYRLVFDDPWIYSGIGVPYTGFVINSWEEFSERLLNGELTFDEKVSIYETFRKDDKGYILFNPYVSYQFSHPMASRISLTNFYHGTTYTASVIFKEEGIFPCFFILHDYAYIKSRQLHRKIFDMLEKDAENIEYEQELPNGGKMVCYNKTITKEPYYYGGENTSSEVEKYILSDGFKKFLVTKKYIYTDSNNDTEHNKLVYIDIYGTTNDNLYFFIDFSSYIDIDDYEFPQEVVTDEFLFGFNVEVIDNAQTV